MIGNIDQLINYSTDKDVYNLYIDIPSFCNNSYLPVIAMSGSEFYLQIKYKKFEDLIIKNTDYGEIVFTYKNEIKTKTIINYINVFDDEKKLLSNARYEFLIQQMYYKEYKIINENIIIDINFKNCIKDLYWIYQSQNALDNKQYYNYTNILYNYI